MERSGFKHNMAIYFGKMTIEKQPWMKMYLLIIKNGDFLAIKC